MEKQAYPRKASKKKREKVTWRVPQDSESEPESESCPEQKTKNTESFRIKRQKIEKKPEASSSSKLSHLVSPSSRKNLSPVKTIVPRTLDRSPSQTKLQSQGHGHLLLSPIKSKNPQQELHPAPKEILAKLQAISKEIDRKMIPPLEEQSLIPSPSGSPLKSVSTPEQIVERKKKLASVAASSPDTHKAYAYKSPANCHTPRGHDRLRSLVRRLESAPKSEEEQREILIRNFLHNLYYAGNEMLQDVHVAQITLQRELEHLKQNRQARKMKEMSEKLRQDPEVALGEMQKMLDEMQKKLLNHRHFLNTMKAGFDKTNRMALGLNCGNTSEPVPRCSFALDVAASINDNRNGDANNENSGHVGTSGDLNSNEYVKFDYNELHEGDGHEEVPFGRIKKRCHIL